MTESKKSKNTFSTQKCRKKIHQEAQKRNVIHTKNYTRHFRILVSMMVSHYEISHGKICNICPSLNLTKHTNTMLDDHISLSYSRILNW